MEFNPIRDGLKWTQTWTFRAASFNFFLLGNDQFVSYVTSLLTGVKDE